MLFTMAAASASVAGSSDRAGAGSASVGCSSLCTHDSHSLQRRGACKRMGPGTCELQVPLSA